MKVRYAAIALVLTAVAIGAFVLVRGSWQPRVQDGYTGDTQLVPNTVTQLMVRKVGASNLFAALGNRPLSWAAIESTNYVVFIHNLRNFGCPEETIRDIIITDIAKLYAKKRAALRTQYPPAPFWHTGDGWTSGSTNPQLHVGLRQLEEEQRALVKELLGVELEVELAKFNDTDELEDQRYQFLAPERRQALHSLISRFDQLEQELYDRTKGLMLEEDQTQLQQLQKMREAEIAQLLTPDEYREYELRNSPTADALREQLSGFNATEEEFRKVFDLQKAYEAQMAKMPLGADEEVRSHVTEQAEDALNEELRKLLGPERYAEYQRAQDADYKTLLQFADRVQIPRDVANQVYDLKARVETQRDTVEGDLSLTEQQRAVALAALAETARTEVGKLMGDNATKYFPVGGHWISDIAAGAGELSAEVSPPQITIPAMPVPAIPVNPSANPPPTVPVPPPVQPGFPPVAPLPPLQPFPALPRR
jgi:hypothetical protein